MDLAAASVDVAEAVMEESMTLLLGAFFAPQEVFDEAFEESRIAIQSHRQVLDKHPELKDRISSTHEQPSTEPSFTNDVHVNAALTTEQQELDLQIQNDILTTTSSPPPERVLHDQTSASSPEADFKFYTLTVPYEPSIIKSLFGRTVHRSSNPINLISPDLPFPGQVIIQRKDLALAHAQNEPDNDPERLVFWTDGSAFPASQSVSAAAVAHRTSPLKYTVECFLVKKNLDSMDAEALAIAQSLRIAFERVSFALSAIPRLVPIASLVVIYTDAVAVLGLIQRFGSGKGRDPRCWPQLGQITKWAYELQRVGVGIQLHWCPGHAGVRGNELADTGATLAVRRCGGWWKKTGLGQVKKDKEKTKENERNKHTSKGKSSGVPAVLESVRAEQGAGKKKKRKRNKGKKLGVKVSTIGMRVATRNRSMRDAARLAMRNMHSEMGIRSEFTEDANLNGER